MNLVQASQDRFGAAGAPSADLFELPLVSVIVINYNFCHLLPQAVESVFSQTYPRVECIIVDSASTDESPAVLRALAINANVKEQLETQGLGVKFVDMAPVAKSAELRSG